MEASRVAAFVGVVIGGLLFLASPVSAQVVGRVSDLKGAAEVQPTRGGWKALAANADVSLGDRLRTAAKSTLTITLRDESVLVLDPESELTIDEQVLPQSGPSASSFSLAVGKVDAAVTTDRYKTPGSRFEVKTRTAVAGVRGSEWFSQYDVGKKNTRICVVKDEAWYQSVAAGNPDVLKEGYCVDCAANVACSAPFAAGAAAGSTAAIAGAGAAAAGAGVGIGAGVTGGFGRSDEPLKQVHSPAQ